MNHKPFLLLGLLPLFVISCGNNTPATSTTPLSVPSEASTPSVPSSDPSIPSATSSDEERTEYDVAVYGDYYSGCLTWSNGADLREKLSRAMHNNFRAIAYDGNWATNQKADLTKYNLDMLDQLYSDEDIIKTKTKGVSQVGFDREHCFAKSLITATPDTKVIGPLTDFHNLYASWTTANNSRGNKNFGMANPNDEFYDSVGPNVYDELVFQPGSDVDKGKVSRAIFYMATMYAESEGLFLREELGTTGSKCHGNLSTLLEWGKLPVDYTEYRHDIRVYEDQRNRNAFVDYPELAEYVFGDKKDEPGELKYLVPTAVALDAITSDFSHYAIQGAKYEFVAGEKFSATNDVGVISVNKDFSLGEACTTYTVEGVSDGEALTSGKHTVTVKAGEDVISYDINVSEDPVSAATWKHKFVKSDFEKLSAAATKTITMDSIAWNETRDSAYDKVTDQTNSNRGIQLGTSTVPVSKLTLETVEPFAYSDKSAITDIYYEGLVGSGTAAKLTAYVGDEEVGSVTIEYVNDGHNTYHIALSEAKTGKVKLVFTGMSKAIYMWRIGINAE